MRTSPDVFFPINEKSFKGKGLSFMQEAKTESNTDQFSLSDSASSEYLVGS